MFREMRRKGQELPLEECERVLRRASAGVLALAGDDGYPYAVPLSFLYREGRLFFHCAREGHKLDALRRCGKASFCVIDRDEVLPEKYSTAYRSVIAFGRVRVLEEAEEKRRALEALALKYAPDDEPQHREREIEAGWNALYVLEMTIDHMTGKAGRYQGSECPPGAQRA